MQRKGNPSTLLVEMQTGEATVESSVAIRQKIKNGSAFWLSNPTPGNVPKVTQNTSLKEHKYPYVHCNIIYNCQDMEAAQMAINKWVDKTMGTFIQWNSMRPLKKKKMFLFATVWMDLENIILSEISQSKKDKYHTISYICGI